MLPHKISLHVPKTAVLATVRSAQMMAVMERGLDLLDVLGHRLRQPLGHAAEAAEGAGASSNLGELLGTPVPASDVGKRRKNFAATVKNNLGEVCMITGVFLPIVCHSCLPSYNF